MFKDIPVSKTEEEIYNEMTDNKKINDTRE